MSPPRCKFWPPPAETPQYGESAESALGTGGVRVGAGNLLPRQAPYLLPATTRQSLSRGERSVDSLIITM